MEASVYVKKTVIQTSLNFVNSVVVRSPASLDVYLNLYQLFSIQTVKCFAMEVIDANPAKSTAQHCGHRDAKQHKANSNVNNTLLMTATQTIANLWVVN